MEHFIDTLSTNFMEETNCMRSEQEEEQQEEQDGDKGERSKEVKNDELQTEDSAVQKQQKSAWAPCLFFRTDKEEYYYAGHKIIIEGGFDSFGGMIWPAALALSHYLDTHHEQLNLVDKAVLEIGAGTGLVSVVAALLGAWVTATDLPDVLNTLRVNLSRNSRGHCRHTPQAVAMSWGYDLESTYPSSVYHYDYVLASDVVYHHDFLDELLATMKHFCKPGTTLIWANKVRFESDLTFTENFKKAFHTSLLYEDGEIKIFMGTCREEEGGSDMGMKIREEEKQGDEVNKEKFMNEKPNQRKGNDNDVTEEHLMLETERRNKKEHECDEEKEQEEIVVLTDDNCKEVENDGREENNHPSCSTITSDEDLTEHLKQTVVPTWIPTVISSLGKNIYRYAGQDIVIYESIDSYGAVMWPAALALCYFLDNNREKVNLQGKKVLELGAGTGLVTVVASLLGASVTATDLPEVLSNLRANVMRNTRGRCRQMPQVAALSWAYNLEGTYPSSVYQYDYVLAADVVYHHDFLDELLATMKHFCRPGTAVIWANKIRLESDLTFIENFKKAFHTSLLYEDVDMKIFMGTSRLRDPKEK